MTWHVKRSGFSGKPVSLVFLLVLFLSGPVWAAEQIFMVDTSSAMAARCGSRGSQLAVAGALVRDEAGRRGSGERSALVGFAERPQVLVDFIGDSGELVRQLRSLKASGQRADMAAALTAATTLWQQSGASQARFLIVGPGRIPAESSAVYERVSALRALGVEVVYVVVGSVEPGAAVVLNGMFSQIRREHCDPRAVSERSKDPRVERVWELAARLSGVAPDLIDPDTDLARDLGLDAGKIYEILAVACDAYDVEVPKRGDLTSVRKIASYLRGAPRRAPPPIVTRGEQPSGDAGEVALKTVYFATDRQYRSRIDPVEMFSGERASRGKMTYGKCEVSIPVAAHQKGVLESPLLRLLTDPTKHIVLRSAKVMGKGSFFDELKEQLALGSKSSEHGDDLLVFIHGFNVTFEEAARRTAQVAYDLRFPGVPAFYSWPSNGELLGYVSDREDVEWSVPHLVDFLEDIVKRAGARRIHLIAHSMGHEGLLRALHLIALKRGSGRPLFDNVVMAAPDFDAEIFSDQLAPQIKGLSRQWTLYASDKDTALNISARLRSAVRLGLPLTVVGDMDTVDATGVEVTPWNVPEFHSYFATKQRVVEDIIAILAGRPPERRDLVKRFKGRLPYWNLH